MFALIQTCRVCGCTDNDCRQCIERTGQPCWWVEQDLCSACAENTVSMTDQTFNMLADWAEGLTGERPESMTVSYRKEEYPEVDEEDMMHYLEDGVLYYALSFNPEFYKAMSIHHRINFKMSYFALSHPDEDLLHMPLRIYTYDCMWTNLKH